jgi:predicted membrane-bound spermidine synthase
MNRFISLLLLTTFFASGCAALVYQLVWQRYLFNGLGVDIDSVTLIVSTFMLGIGLGGAAGGWLSDHFPQRRVQLYAAAELLLCVIGFCSPMLLGFLPDLNGLGWSYWTICATAMALLLVPTSIMGTTLPLLTMEFDNTRANVGVSVGMLYFFNTLGAAFGTWMVGHVLFMQWGLRASAFSAAAINLLCFLCAMGAARLQSSSRAFGQLPELT